MTLKMLRQELRDVDRDGWLPGPWTFEMDRVLYEHVESGYRCAANRNAVGCWCGYVGVSLLHPTYHKHYDDVDCRVHGGLTFSDHWPELVDGDKDLWLLGFDCGHTSDGSPDVGHWYFLSGEYRTLSYVENEIDSLANQLLKMKKARKDRKRKR